MKTFNEFVNEGKINLEELRNNYWMPSEKDIKKIFSFVGEGVDDVDVPDKQNPSYIYINFYTEASGNISIKSWKKAESILDKWEKDEIIAGYNIEERKSRIVIDCIEK